MHAPQLTAASAQVGPIPLQPPPSTATATAEALASAKLPPTTAPIMRATPEPAAAAGPQRRAERATSGTSSAVHHEPSKALASRRALANPRTAPAPLATSASAPTATPSGPNAAVLNQSATQALLQGHIGLAADLYARSTQENPRDEVAWRGLGLTSERLGRKADAARTFRRVLQLSPEGPNAPTIRARLAQLEATP